VTTAFTANTTTKFKWVSDPIHPSTGWLQANQTDFVVPSGVTHVKVRTMVEWQDVNWGSGANRYAEVRLDNVVVQYGYNFEQGTGRGGMYIATRWFAVTPGQIITVTGFVPVGTSSNTLNFVEIDYK